MSIKQIPVSDFKLAVIDSSLHNPIAVFFTASWCEPCQEVNVLLETVAKEYEERLNIAVIDIDEKEVDQVLDDCKVESIPDLKLFHKKELVAQAKGVLSKAQIDKLLEPYVLTEQQYRIHVLEKQIEILLASEQYEEAQSIVGIYISKYPLDQEVKLIEIAIAVKMNLVDVAKQLIQALPAALKENAKAKEVIGLIENMQNQTVQ